MSARHPEHNEGQYSNPHTCSEFQKHPRNTAGVQQQQQYSRGTTAAAAVQQGYNSSSSAAGLQQQQQRYNISEPRNAHIQRNACVPPFQLAPPSRCTSADFSPSAAGLFSSCVYTRRKFEPRPGSVARALGVPSPAIWQVVAGSLSAELEPTRPMDIPKLSSLFTFFTSLLLFLKCHSSRQRLGRYGTTAALQAFPSVTAPNGASGCVCERARVCLSVIEASYSSKNQEHSSLTTRGALQYFLLFFIFTMLSAAAAAAVCLYHTVRF